MKIYKELEQIAAANEQIEELAEKLEKVIDCDGFDLRAAYFVDGCIEKDGHLYNGEGHRYDNSGLVDDEYYCDQYTGYLEDDFLRHGIFQDRNRRAVCCRSVSDVRRYRNNG